MAGPWEVTAMEVIFVIKGTPESQLASPSTQDTGRNGSYESEQDPSLDTEAAGIFI